jgi:hypothetical protein
VFESGGQRIGIVALDLPGVAISRVAAIRVAGQKAGIPGGNIMVACTHNHAGPAVSPETSLPTDEVYLASMQERIADGLQRASDKVVGLVVNFACHACHHGGDAAISAGYPGQLCLALKALYGPD